MSRTALVTGGASGIGAALARALVGRGDSVVIADLDSAGASAVADELNQQGFGRARAEGLDVRDAESVRSVVEEAHCRDGRLDLLFNNAGIGVGGAVEELTLSHWERAIDVNLRGVVHGVAAAYPIMLRQGHGHIVNTASVAGLIPAPFITPYSMTKHAVVGLSLSLRGEAAAHGVRVSALCPGTVDTAILDRGNPRDLPGVRTLDGREYVTKVAGAPYSADALATDVLRAVERNRPVIVAPRRARVAWRLHRAVPWIVEQMTLRNVAWARERYGLSPMMAVGTNR
jgi:NAD(P)-dependent dehydrogenase (short-subunit alcohol dehydrogenase family)